MKKVNSKTLALFNLRIQGLIMITDDNQLWVKMKKKDLKKDSELKEFFTKGPFEREENRIYVAFMKATPFFGVYNIIKGVDALREMGVGVKML